MLGYDAYGYPVGRVRALENRLFGRIALERMLEADSVKDALAVLAENGYDLPVQEDGWNARQCIALLEQEEDKVVRELKSFSPEPQLYDLFLLKYDYNNVKLYLKQETQDAETPPVLSDAGTIPVRKLEEGLREKDYRCFPVHLRETLPGAREAMVADHTPRAMEFLLDQAFYRDCYAIADQAERRETRMFLRQWVAASADLSNLQTLLRIRQMADPETLFTKSYVPGSLSCSFYLSCLHLELAKLAEAFARTPYGRLAADAVAKYNITGSLSHLEKLSDDYLLEFVKARKGNAFGIEPLVGYLVARQREIRNVRMILLGKLNDLPREIIRERLRSLYV